MPIDFSPERWENVRASYEKWWNGQSDRPLVTYTITNRDPGRPQPYAPILSQQTCTDLSIPADALVDRWDWELSRLTFLGDSYPRINLDTFGPGVGAAFAGAILDNSAGRVWFHSPCPDAAIEDIHIEYQPGNVWLERIKDICKAAMDRWQGQVLVGMTDLGGNLDTVASFVTSERLLLELYDNPDEVTRLTWEAHEVWHKAYSEINDVLMPVNPGYGDWSGIYSSKPSYITQCDFAYMIGPIAFKTFVAPELTATCKRLGRATYHVDGTGQIPHIKHLAEIPEIKCIQWVPGAGNPTTEEWPEVNRAIGEAGRLLYSWGDFDAFEKISAQYGKRTGIFYNLTNAWDGVEEPASIQAKIDRLATGSSEFS